MSRPGRSRARQRERERVRRAMAGLPISYVTEEVARRLGSGASLGGGETGHIRLELRDGHLVGVAWSQWFSAAELDRVMSPTAKEVQARTELDELREYVVDNRLTDHLAQQLQQEGFTIAGLSQPSRPVAEQVANR